MSLLALEETGTLEVLDVPISLDEVELSLGDSLEVRFSFEDSLEGVEGALNRSD